MSSIHSAFLRWRWFSGIFNCYCFIESNWWLENLHIWYKLFFRYNARLLLILISNHLVSTQHPEQTGFMPKRLTIDRILIKYQLYKNIDLSPQGEQAGFINNLVNLEIFIGRKDVLPLKSVDDCESVMRSLNPSFGDATFSIEEQRSGSWFSLFCYMAVKLGILRFTNMAIWTTCLQW